MKSQGFEDVRFEDFEYRVDLSAIKRIMAIINQIAPSLSAGYGRNEEHVKKLFSKGRELAVETEDPITYGIMLWQSLLSVFEYPIQDIDPELKKLITIECLQVMFEKGKKPPRQIY